MRSKYEFHRDDGVIWTLVFDPISGLWHIEKLGPCGEQERIALREFENSEHGRKLGGQLAEAMHQV